MRAKPSKCHALALSSSSGRLYNPLASQEDIPYAGGGPVKFLGLDIGIPHDTSSASTTSNQHLKRMLQAVDVCPL